jgi:ribosomal protein L20
MPVIPGANESQVLNPGSPVPIGSDSEARYQGETIAQFGKAVSYLGNTLQGVATQAEKEKQKLQLLGAMNEFQMKALQKRAEQQAAAPIAGDKTGFGAVESYAKNLQPDMQEIAAKIEDPTARSQFLVGAGQHVNDDAVKIWADEVKKKAEVNKFLLNDVISSSGQIAMKDPTQIDNELAKVETAILDNDDIPGEQKQIKVHEARRSIVMDAIQGRIDDKTRQYDTAHMMLDKYGAFFDSKEKKALIDEIQNTRWNYTNRTAKEETVNYNRQMRELKAPWIKMKYSMFAQLEQPGVDPTTISKTLDTMVAANMMPQAQANAIMSPNPIPPQQDQIYSRNVIAEAIKTGDIEGALDKVGEEVGMKVSSRAGIQLRDNLVKLRNQMQKDPVFSKKVENVEKSIDAFSSANMTMGMSPAERAELSNQVEGAKSQFYNRLAADPTQDPSQISGEIVQHALAHTYRFPEVKSAQTLADVQKVGEDLIRNREFLKQKGLLTEAINNDQVTKLREIQRRKLEMSLNVRGK